MTNKEIYDNIKSAFGDKLGDWHEMTGSEYQKRTSSYADVDSASVRDVCLYLRDTNDLLFDNLNLLSCEDNGDKTVSVIYHMESTVKEQNFALRVTVGEENPTVPSVADIWISANWQEREGYDMIGVKFFGHPDMRRILLDDDWVGHPLKKDYKHPEFYRGMKVPY